MQRRNTLHFTLCLVTEGIESFMKIFHFGYIITYNLNEWFWNICVYIGPWAIVIWSFILYLPCSWWSRYNNIWILSYKILADLAVLSAIFSKISFLVSFRTYKATSILCKAVCCFRIKKKQTCKNLIDFQTFAHVMSVTARPVRSWTPDSSLAGRRGGVAIAADVESAQQLGRRPLAAPSVGDLAPPPPAPSVRRDKLYTYMYIFI